jgi:hypothetical protein
MGKNREFLNGARRMVYPRANRVATVENPWPSTALGRKASEVNRTVRKISNCCRDKTDLMKKILRQYESLGAHPKKQFFPANHSRDLPTGAV